MAQEAGKEPQAMPDDTTFIFNSPRKLTTYGDEQAARDLAWAFDLTFSGSGFGAGFMLQKKLGNDFQGFFEFLISGARNTDEFETFDFDDSAWRVDDKINRVFIFPIALGMNYQIFSNAISESFRPYLTAGGGITYVLTTPYRENRQPDSSHISFFEAFGEADHYVRPLIMGGIGGSFGSGSNHTAFNIRYYYIPFSEGLESVAGVPMYNLGGVFLTFSVGMYF
ncbi:MAG: hypothetical protein ACLFR2_03015 [Candidatus Kapaibacterium sp.]